MMEWVCLCFLGIIYMDNKPVKCPENNGLESSNLYEDTDIADYVCNKFSDAIRALPDDLLELGESELTVKSKATDIDWTLRFNFWEAFERCFSKPPEYVRKIYDNEIYHGVISKRSWFMKLDNPLKVAFIIRPLDTKIDRNGSFNLAASIAHQRLLQILKLPLQDDDNVSNSRINAVLKACQMAFDRQLGRSIERSMIRVHQTREDKPPESMDTSELAQEISALIEDIKTED